MSCILKKDNKFHKMQRIKQNGSELRQSQMAKAMIIAGKNQDILFIYFLLLWYINLLSSELIE